MVHLIIFGRRVAQEQNKNGSKTGRNVGEEILGVGTR